MIFIFFFFNDTATTEIYTLSLHDALPIYLPAEGRKSVSAAELKMATQLERRNVRSEEHTSELQSPCNLVCRLLLEKKNIVAPELRIVPPPTNERYLHTLHCSTDLPSRTYH